LRPIAAQA
jgi:hypothetical protein